MHRERRVFIAQLLSILSNLNVCYSYSHDEQVLVFRYTYCRSLNCTCYEHIPYICPDGCSAHPVEDPARTWRTRRMPSANGACPECIWRTRPVPGTRPARTRRTRRTRAGSHAFPALQDFTCAVCRMIKRLIFLLLPASWGLDRWLRSMKCISRFSGCRLVSYWNMSRVQGATQANAGVLFKRWFFDDEVFNFRDVAWWTVGGGGWGVGWDTLT